MLNESNMDFVLKKFKKYISSIEEFQSGNKLGEQSDNLNLLDEDLKSNGNLKELSKVNPDHISDNFKDFIEAISKVELVEGVIPYSNFTHTIYKETQYNRELYDTLGDTMKADWIAYVNSASYVSPETTRIFLKIKEHVALSIIQTNHINDTMKEQLVETRNKLNKTEQELEDLTVEIKKVENESKEKADKIVVNFITILGIFAAIMMGTIGSFQSFTSIFSNAEKIPLGKILLISSAGASGVSLILFLLLHAISKLTSFSISNCECSNKRRGALTSVGESIRLSMFGGTTKPKCTCSMFDKYPTIFIVNYLFYYIAFTGFVFMYFSFYNYFNMNLGFHLLVIGSFYFIATIILLFVHRYIIDKHPDKNFLNKFIKDLRKIAKYIKGSR